MNAKAGLVQLDDMSKLTNEEFIEKAKIKHQNYYSYEKCNYLGTDRKVTITCPVHGDFEQRASGHLWRGSGCKTCTYAKKPKRAKGWHWKQKEIEALRQNYPSKSILDCSELIGKDRKSIARKIKELNISKRTKSYEEIPGFYFSSLIAGARKRK